MNVSQPFRQLRDSLQALRDFIAQRIARVSFNQVVIAYLIALTLAEAVTTLLPNGARLGMVMHGLLLVAVFLLASFYHEGMQAAFLYSLALAPLIRLTSLSLPLPRFPFVYWYALVGLPLLLGGFFAMRINHLSNANVGLRLTKPFQQTLIALCGIGLGALEYMILRPAPLIDAFSLQEIILPALILLIFTGFLEEFIFRGLMQYTGYQNFGWLGIFYVSTVFAILHIGYKSILDVVFVFAVAVFFAVMAQKTGSIVGVTVAHGLTNIGLFLVFPFIIGSQMLNPPPPNIPRFLDFAGGASQSTATSTPTLAELPPQSQPAMMEKLTAYPTASPTQLATIPPTATSQVTQTSTLLRQTSPVPPTPRVDKLTAYPTPSPKPTHTARPLPTHTRPATIPLSPTLEKPAASPTPSPTPTNTARPLPTHTQPATIPPSPTLGKPIASPTPSPTQPSTVKIQPSTVPSSEMILIPKGIFRMGCNPANEKGSCQPGELPLHSVTLPDYFIDRSEVTNAQYAACVASGACRPPANLASVTRSDYFGNPAFDNYPVVNVAWWDAASYCLWAGKRLPSEAEWEKAARIDKDAPVFPWGNSKADCSRTNFADPTGSCNEDTNQVGSYLSGASPAGVLDLAGNVAEWVFDWYSPTYYSSSVAANPTGPLAGTQRVVRGGSWQSPGTEIRAAFRAFLPPEITNPSVGFRCAKSP